MQLMMQRFMVVLSVEYVLMALGFAVVKDWARFFYIVGATMLNVAVMFMK
jgi:hypothetical protein